ncbi:MAG: DUF115 domain-containing protein [Treponema sp.]|jgi:hypothetical protein|nr:DUF115 domain-containing protein [Treponema sp.]
MPGETPRRVPARRGFTVSYRGKTLLSAVDPLAQAERAAKALKPLDRTLYLCPSPLLGYGLSPILNMISENKHDSAILCVEADEKLLEFSLEHLDPALLRNPRLAFAALDGGSGSAERICGLVRRKWGSRRFRRVETLRFNAGWRLYPELYGRLEDLLRKAAAADWGNAMTLVKLGRLYIRNALRNLASLPRSSSLSSLSLGPGPVLVLGAGPSLDGILAGLSRRFGAGAEDPVSRPFRILCVDTALPCLRARGIKPDLAVALESQHWNLRDFVGLGDWEIPVAMDLSALPATAETLGGRTFFFFTPWTEMNFFRRLGEAGLRPETFIPLGSVGLSAAAVALRLSGSTVIACGIDFSFTLDSYHARSSPGHREKLRRQNRFTGILNAAAAFREAAFTAVSKAGLPVRSDPAMRGYRDLFEREFAGEERLWDTSGPGLPLGLRSLSPGEALAILAGGKPPGQQSSAEKAPGISIPGIDEPDINRPGINEPGINAPGASAAYVEKLERFVSAETENLSRLRDLLSGKAPAGIAELDKLLDYCDYLWAHFPDCAGTDGRRPPATDISFLKRVRTETDPFLAILNRTLAEIRRDAR